MSRPSGLAWPATLLAFAALATGGRTGAAGAPGPIFTVDGVWNPAPEHQRYRAAEYPGDFVQWWYYAVSDADTATHFAFAYYLNACPSNPGLEGLYVYFSMVSPAGNFTVIYRYPLSAVNHQGNHYQMSLADGLHQILPAPAGGLVRTIGLMNDPASVWACDQTAGMTSISPRTVIGWDVTFTRVIGCYIGAELEGAPVSPDLLWNAYQFDSVVSGSIHIDGRLHILSPEGTRFRGYCDQNFGVDFPRGTPAIDYRWGWFHAVKRNADPANDVAIIAGIGVSDRAMGLPIDVEGFYAATFNTLGRNVAWKQAVGKPLRFRTPLAKTCSWGRSLDRFVNCRVSAEAWFTYTDAFGSASIPGRQRVTLEGEFIRITMDFCVTADDVNRLLCPFKRGLWSNFEALGAECRVDIYEKAYRWYDIFRLSPSLMLRDSFTDHHAGLEYGYFIPYQRTNGRSLRSTYIR